MSAGQNLPAEPSENSPESQVSEPPGNALPSPVGVTAPLAQFVKNQEKSLRLQEQEQANEFILAQKDQELQESQQGIDERSFQTQADLYKFSAKEGTKRFIVLMIAGGLVCLALIAIAFYAIRQDKEDIVMEAFKILASLAVGLFGGYQWGARRSESGANKGKQPPAV